MISLSSLIIIAVCLLFFFSVNLHNILRYHRGSTAETAKPEAEEPHGFKKSTGSTCMKPND